MTQTFDAAHPENSVTPNPVKVDETSSGDPNTKYTIAAPPGGWNPTSGPGGVPIPGYEANWGRRRYLAQVTGINTGYNSSVPINVGLGYGPVDITTVYR